MRQKNLLKKGFMLLTLLLLPFSAKADYSGKCGADISYTFDSATGTLTLSGTGFMDDYATGYSVSNRVPWNNWSKSIKTLIVGNGITSIGTDAFYGCTNLVTVTLPSTLVVIKATAFLDCKSLKSVEIPLTVTYIGANAFHGCTAMTSLTLPSNRTTIAYYAFRNCTGLTSLVIPKGVTDIDPLAFADCNGLSSIVVDCENKRYDSRDKCNAIITTATDSLIIGCNNSSIPQGVATICSNAFLNCTDLTYLTIPSSVKTIGNYAFAGCKGIKSLSLSDGLEKIGDYAFNNCSGIASLTIPTSVTSIGHDAFGSCTNLSSVTLNCSMMNYRVQSIFDKSDNIKKATINSTNVNYSWLVGKKIETLELGDDVQTVSSGVFAKCDSLHFLSIGKSVKTIADDAFTDCKIDEVAFKCDTIGPWYKSYPSITKAVMSFPTRVPSNYKGDRSKLSPTYSIVKAIGDDAFRGCKLLEGLAIPNTVASIGAGAFYGCEKLDSCIMPESVTSIGNQSFYDCHNIKKTVLSEAIIDIPWSAFKNCISLQDILLPSRLKTIGSQAFENCRNLASISLPDSLIQIGNGAFNNCISLTSVTIPKSVETMDGCFTNCNSLTSVTLSCSTFIAQDRPSKWDSYQRKYVYISMKSIFGDQVKSYVLGEGVTRLGKYTFSDCQQMLAVTIPSTLTSIGENAFADCKGLKKVIVSDIAAWCNINYDQYAGKYNQSNPLFNASHLYSDEQTEITRLIIPEGVTAIGNLAFANCDGLTAVTFPSTLKTIGEFAFIYCDGLTAVTVPEGTTEINSAFWGCSNLTSVSLPSTLTAISSSAFNDCRSLSTINIPDNISSIGNNAFAGCTSLQKLTFPDNIASIGNNAFVEAIKLYVNRKSATLLAMWQAGYTPYLTGSESILEPPYLSVVSTTQTTATFKLENKYDEYKYGYGYLNDITPMTEDTIKVTDLYPEVSSTYVIYAYLPASQDINYAIGVSYFTQPIAPVINVRTTASSVHAMASYNKGDAEVISQRFVLNPSSIGKSKIYGGIDIDGLQYDSLGLDPQSYGIRFAYEVVVAGPYNNTKAYHTEIVDAIPLALTITTQQPKVVSVGNVIVAADSNLDDDETNVGFEWRRTDWTDDFASSKAGGCLYDGTMEGYIRSLNTDKLWKYRPYYISNSGRTYYGQWVGIDPTNTSYFEPTVHTYAKVDVSEGTAILNGYAITGTEEITEQGFEYWTEQGGTSAARRTPQDVQTITATGQRMTATLTGLKEGTTYSYRAYVKTDKGTTYGEQRSFTTPAVTGIAVIDDNAGIAAESKTLNVYSLSGLLVRSQATTLKGLPRGIYIVNRRKVFVK